MQTISARSLPRNPSALTAELASLPRPVLARVHQEAQAQSAADKARLCHWCGVLRYSAAVTAVGWVAVLPFILHR